ncbi:MAG: BLUF domain-containing protein [Alphaproteobacteria bacterium]|nr:BLUF domain-containing protein [Alphaproteobacteria bacterium]
MFGESCCSAAACKVLALRGNAIERLVYTSHASSTLANTDVFSIVETSSRNNSTRDVTGLLVYVGARFLQLLEGETDALDELMVVLARDPRHRELTVHHRSPAATRAFPHWRMRRLDTSLARREEVLRALSVAEIEPRCVKLIREFMTEPERASVQAVSR